MPPITYNIVSKGEDSTVTVFPPGAAPLVAQADHPNFERIVAACAASTVIEPDADAVEGVFELFDIAQAASRRFENLSERVTAANGRIYFDGDEVDSSLTQSILRFLDEDVADWQPLVAFFENVMQNPNQHSREQLYDWLRVREGITITDGGLIVGYKGVRKQADGTFVSGRAGTAQVDGEEIRGNIPNPIGSVVTMPRAEVAHDPSAACSTGLHVGTFQFASGFNEGAMLEVHVNPRDVVSVPTDGGGEKIRVCRYYVQDEVEVPHSTAVTSTAAPEDIFDYDEEYEDDWDFEEDEY